MNERLLIAGAGGVIGRQLALIGFEQGYQVYGTFHEKLPAELDYLRHQKKITIFQADLRKKTQVDDIMEITKPDVIVNLAGHSESKALLGQLVLDENMAILENLIYSVLCSGREQEKKGKELTFLQAGTIWEYGQKLGADPIVEVPLDKLVKPDESNFYVQSKLQAEDLLSLLYQTQKGVNPIMMRLAHHTGEGKYNGLTAIGADAVIKVKEGKEDDILIRNKFGRIDLSYARDGARAISVLMQRGIPGEAYNVARGCDYTIEEILLSMARKLSLPPSVRVVSNGEEMVTHARFSIRKLSLLGFKPRFTIMQTINRFMDWYYGQNSNKEAKRLATAGSSLSR